jgi:hypothetical protein
MDAEQAQGGNTMNVPGKPEHLALPEGWGYDLLLYGNDQVIQGSDTGTLIALGSIAFQALRGKGLPHQHFGCGILLLSVLFCAMVHFSVGGASVSRARAIIRGWRESMPHRMFRQANQLFAWFAAAVQFVLIVIGMLLVLKDKPPELLQRYLLDLF